MPSYYIMSSEKRSDPPRAIRVLCIDEDPSVFDLFQKGWAEAALPVTVTVCSTIEEAREFLLYALVDVWICGPKLAGEGKPSLIEEMRARYPTTLRLLLTSDKKSDALSIPASIAHQLIARDMAPLELYNTIEAALHKLSGIREDRVAQTLTWLEKLPSRNAMMAEFLELLSGQTPSVDKICATVSKHPGMVARILKIANSPYFGHAGGIEGLDDAIGILGIDMISSLFFSMQLVTMDQPPRNSRLDVEALWNHSVQVSAIARRIGLSMRVGSGVLKEALTAALLHDLGKVVLAHALPTECAAALTRAEVDRIPLWQSEKPVLGNSHAEVGGCLLRLWGFPAGLVDSVTAHHAPHRLGDGVVKSVVLVHIADAVAHASDPRGLATFLDTAYIESLGLNPDLGYWQATASFD